MHDKTRLSIIIIFMMAFTILTVNMTTPDIVGQATVVTNNIAIKTLDSKAVLLDSFSIPTTNTLSAMNINKEFISSQKIPINFKSKINGLSINGNVEYLGEPALVRIVLVDSSNKEYLIYESYGLLDKTADGLISFSNICEETCILGAITPKYIKVDLKNAKSKIISINYLTSDKSFSVKNPATYKKTQLANQQLAKISSLNTNQNSWTAGVTSVSGLSYEQKRRLFVKLDGTTPEYLPDLQGFEYYNSGVFIIDSGIEEFDLIDRKHSYPVQWDWRNVHGQNWMTPVKSQGWSGMCTYFASVASLESFINLYYNQHIDLDLSEQQLRDCSFPGEIINLSYGIFNSQSFVPGKLIYHGVVDEACDPFANREISNGCNYENVCNNWSERLWKIADFDSYAMFDTFKYMVHPRFLYVLNNEEDFKKTLITRGPMRVNLNTWGHAMTVVGYISNNSNLPYWRNEKTCYTSQLCSANDCINKLDPCQPGKKLCSLSADSSWQPANYFCNQTGQWQVESYCDGQCINNKCAANNYQPVVGDNRCVDANYGTVREKYSMNRRNIWIFKNSWGTDWGEGGYGYIQTNLQSIDTTLNDAFYNIAQTPDGANYEIQCSDNDGDRYCYWGITESKPANCPKCNAEKDCDDSNSNLGPFIDPEYNLNCQVIG